MKLLLLVIACFSSLGYAQFPKVDGLTEPAPYLRVHYTDDRLAELQIGLRKMVSETKGHPVICLVGVSHLGDAAYYKQLQKTLNRYELVLYEGVGDSPRKMQEARTEGQPPNSLQGDLAESLGLVFQLGAIDYTSDHFKNSDVSMAGLRNLMLKAADESEAGKQASQEMSQLIATMQGSGALSGLVDGLMDWLKSSPHLKNTVKLMFIETLGNIKGDLGAGSMPPEMKKLMELLIDERNKIVLQDLRAELKKAKPVKSIAVFYGAAHMHDLEERIVQLGYRAQKDRWLPAISLDIQEAGIRKQDVLMIRRMVKMQLDALK